MGLNGVLHEQGCLRVQTAVLHGAFHGDQDAFQTFGDVAQLFDVVALLFEFTFGFASFGDFDFEGIVGRNDQLGFVGGFIFHGDEQLLQTHE